MDANLRTLVVVALVLGQSGVVTATADGAAVASLERPDGTGTADATGKIELASVTNPLVATALAGPDDVGTFVADVGESIRDLVPTLFLPPFGYSRNDGSDPLENDTRRTVYEAVLDTPGTYPTKLAVETGVPASTVRYHLRVLEGEGLVETEKVRGKRRVVEATVADAGVESALADDETAAVIDAVERAEPASVSALAAALDRSTSTVSYHVSRLEESGLLARERDGARVLVSLTSTTRSRLEEDAGAD